MMSCLEFSDRIDVDNKIYRNENGEVMFPSRMSVLPHCLLDSDDLLSTAGAILFGDGGIEQKLSLQLARTSVQESSRGGWAPIWRAGSFTGWSDPPGDCNVSAKMLRSAFQYSSLLKESFVSETEFLTGITTFNLMMSCLEFSDRIDVDNKIYRNENGEVMFPSRMSVLPHCLLDSDDLLSTAGAILFGDGGIEQKLCEENNCTVEDFLKYWPKWLKASEAILQSLRYSFADIPEFLFRIRTH